MNISPHATKSLYYTNFYEYNKILMCAGCGALGIPVCAASGLCAANIHDFIQILLISSGAGGGSILVWLQTRLKK